MLTQCVIYPEYSIEKAVAPFSPLGRIQAKDIITPRIPDSTKTIHKLKRSRIKMHIKDEAGRKMAEDTEGWTQADSSLSALMQKLSRTGDAKKGPGAGTQVSLSTPARSDVAPSYLQPYLSILRTRTPADTWSHCRNKLMGTRLLPLPSQTFDRRKRRELLWSEWKQRRIQVYSLKI